MEIEKGVKITTSRRGRPAAYPFGKMSVGDSVLIAGEKTGGKAYNAAMAHGRYHGKVFSSRAADNGIRIWRIS